MDFWGSPWLAFPMNNSLSLLSPFLACHPAYPLSFTGCSWEVWASEGHPLALLTKGLGCNGGNAHASLKAEPRQIDWLKDCQAELKEVSSPPQTHHGFSKTSENFICQLSQIWLYNEDISFSNLRHSLLLWSSSPGDNIYLVKCPPICNTFHSMPSLLFCHLTFAHEFLIITKTLDKDLTDSPHSSTLS